MILLSEKLNTRDNNYNLIRFLAASMVLFAHSYDLLGVAFHSSVEYIGVGISELGVDIFFITSGFLVTISLIHSKSLKSFVWSRFLRIYPALLASIIFCIALGIIFTNLTFIEYITHENIKIFISMNLNLLDNNIMYSLPGVFDSNLSTAINGSLWTLPWEIKMYIILFFIGILRYFKTDFFSEKRLKMICWILVLYFLSLSFLNRMYPTVTSLNVTPILRFIPIFFSGSLFYLYREQIPLKHSLFVLLLLIELFFSINYELGFYFHSIFIGYLVLYLAYIPNGYIRNFNKLGDYSYGLYIYAFPIQQAIINIYPTISPLVLFVISFLITLLLSILSWHFLEMRMLKFKNIFNKKSV